MEETFFYQPVKNNLITYDNIGEIATDQGYDYTTGCLLDYLSFKNYYQILVSKKQALDVDLNAIQQINFTANLSKEGNNFFRY